MSNAEEKDQSGTRLEEGSTDDAEKQFQQETTIEASSEQQSEIRGSIDDAEEPFQQETTIEASSEQQREIRGSIDDAEKPFQQETTLKASSEQQSEIRTPPSECFHTTTHVGPTFSAEEGSILEPCEQKQSPFSITGGRFSPEQAPLMKSDAIRQLDRCESPCIAGIGTSRQSSLTDEDLTEYDRRDLPKVSDFRTSLEHCRPTQISTEVIFNEELLEAREIGVPKTTKDRQALTTKEAKPTDGGVERRITDSTNTTKPKRYFTSEVAAEASLDTQDAEILLRTNEPIAQQDLPGDEGFDIPLSQLLAAVAEVKKPFTQPAPRASGVKKKQVSFAVSGVKKKQVSFAVSGVKKKQAPPVASGVKKKHARRGVSGAKKKHSQQCSSFYEEMRKLHLAKQNVPTNAGFKKLISRLAASIAEKMKKPFTQLAPPVASGAKMNHPQESPFLDEMKKLNLGAPVTQHTPPTFAKYKASFTQQASSAAAAKKAPFTRPPQSDNIEIKTKFPQQSPSLLAELEDSTQQTPPFFGDLQYPTQQSPTFPAELQEPTQQSPPFLAELQDLTQQSPPFLAQLQDPTHQSPPFPAQLQDPTQQSPPFLPQLHQDPTQSSPYYISRINPFYHQAAEGMKTRRTQHPPSVQPNEEASTSEELPEINVRNINRGIRGRRFQKLFPQTGRPPYRSLTERMCMEAFMEVVNVDKDKKKKKKKKTHRYKYDDESSESSSSSSCEGSKSPPKSDHSDPELQFYMEL